MPSDSPTIKEAAMAHLAKPEVIEAAKNIQKAVALTPEGYCISANAFSELIGNCKAIFNDDVIAYHDSRKREAARILGVGK